MESKNKAFANVSFDPIADILSAQDVGDNNEERMQKLSKLLHMVQQHFYTKWVDALGMTPQRQFDEVWHKTMSLELLVDPKRGACANPACDQKSTYRSWCTGCYAISYCSTECQRKHRQAHKSQCSKALKLQDWTEYEFAAIRAFNLCFKLLMANIQVKGGKPMGMADKRMTYRGWRGRVFCEKVGGYCATTAVDIVVEELGWASMLRFCISTSCHSEDCQKARQHFIDKGMVPHLGQAIAVPLKKFEEFKQHAEEMKSESKRKQ